MILAIDQGTTGSTCIVFDARGVPVGRAQREFRQHFPQPGWVEHDAAEIWEVTHAVAGEALADAGVRAGELAAVGIANQRETVCVWDPDAGEPLHRAIVWQDRRTAARCEELRAAGHEPLVRARTGLVLDPYFSATKIEWLLEHVEGLRERARAGRALFGTVDSWLAFKLTGEHLTDPSNAARTMLYDIVRGRWDPELLELFGVPERALPEVRASAGVLARTRPAALHGHAAPLAGIAGDQQAALFGQACTVPGMGKNTYGTGSFVLLNAGSTAPAPAEGLLSTVAWGTGSPASATPAGTTATGTTPASATAAGTTPAGTTPASATPAITALAPGAGAALSLTYALEASIFVTGAAVQWLRDGLGIIAHAAETESLAASLHANEQVYFVPALTGLGSPHWDPHARGTIVGLTRGSTRAHLARAALEAIAYQTVDAVRAMEAGAGRRLRELRADGGATANRWLMQFQADVLGVPVIVPRLSETTALGAASLAGVGAGVWRAGEPPGAASARTHYEPRMAEGERAHLLAGWHAALDRARGTADYQRPPTQRLPRA
ncbi:MAG TPA: glycerol kinase [Solirubrobacteraceae bacterium]|jgi:glycerol kinase|nr:glycerol kinase [Solirubrobacteraceae bacterium]